MNRLILDALQKLRLQLDADWRSSWRWASMRFSAASAVMQIYGAIALKGAGVSASVLGLIPMRWALALGALVAISAMVGRLVSKKPTPAH